MTTIPPTAPAIAFLGTGRMGAPMAANLARGGFGVRVWNRTSSRAEALTADGAVVASSPAQAVRDAAIVITMLADGSATEQAATGPDGLLAAGPGTIWVQMATVGADWTARLASLADARGIVFVDAPVSGSEGPARAGELVILASGPPHVRDLLAKPPQRPCPLPVGWTWTPPRSWTCCSRPRSGRPMPCRRLAACWPGTSAPPSRSGTP